MPKILVADDSELDLHLTRRALRKALPEWEIDAVEDGEEASRHLKSDATPELVLLDFKMPGMGASEILTSLEPDFHRRVPIVLFSSSVSPTDVNRCLELGIREYVEKPTDPTDYANAVQSICQKWAASSA